MMVKTRRRKESLSVRNFTSSSILGLPIVKRNVVMSSSFILFATIKKDVFTVTTILIGRGDLQETTRLIA